MGGNLDVQDGLSNEEQSMNAPRRAYLGVVAWFRNICIRLLLLTWPDTSTPR